MSGKYAKETEVSSSRSREEIEKFLTRYGANKFQYGWDEDRAAIAFEAEGRRIRFVLPLPDKNDPEITHTAVAKLRRSAAETEKFYEQAVRQKWRALALVIKAKLEAVETGITTFEDEFLAHIVLPNNQLVGDWLKPQIEQAYLDKKLPPLLSYGAKS